MTSLKKNFLYNSLLRFVRILFPIITFPYVSRILGPASVGRIEFANSYVNYFIYFAALGIPIYGIREISRVREDKNKLNIIYSELLIILICSTLIAGIIFLPTIFFIERLKKETVLLILFSINLFTNIFQFEWLFSGFEDYKYIFTRNLAINIFSMLALFVFVKTENDYINYVIIYVVVNNITNFISLFYSRKYVKFTFKEINPLRHLRSVFYVFASTLAVSLYIFLDKVILGFLTDNENIGYYTAATKITRVILAFLTALSPVLLPRLSYYTEKNEHEKLDQLLNKSLDYIYFMAIPLVVFIFLLAPNIITILAGEKFIPAAVSLRIICPILFFITMSNFMGTQILFTKGFERVLFLSPLGAAITSIVCNFLLIPVYKHNGAAVAQLLSEFISFFIHYILLTVYFPYKIFKLEYLKIIAAVFISGSFIYILNNYCEVTLLNTFFVATLGLSVYFLVNFLLKFNLMKELLEFIKISTRNLLKKRT